MAQYLCISIIFLDKSYHGKSDTGTPEWPPSPYRLFQALIAAAFIGRNKNSVNDDYIKAFHWLENLNPPLIIAPDVIQGKSIKYYVPNNERDEIPERSKRLTEKIVTPLYLTNSNQVSYLWEYEESENNYCGLIIKLSKQIVSLGLGIDQVIGSGTITNEIPKYSGKLWRPDGNSTSLTKLRVPIKGSFDELLERHKSFLYMCQLEKKNKISFKNTLRPAKYKFVYYYREGFLKQRPCVLFELSNPDVKIAFLQTHIAKVSAMVRSVACSLAKGTTHFFPGGSEQFVAGHISNKKEKSSRFSYFPLPSIGHEYADGLIRRVLIAEPFGGNGKYVAWIKPMLNGERLKNEDKEDVAVLAATDVKKDKVVQYYIGNYGGSRIWSTVTPVILPGFDDGKYVKAIKLFAKAIEHAGIPLEAVEDIILRKAPSWHGSFHPSYYFRPAHLKNYPAWHACIKFKDSVIGPIAIGAGRHYGLGLFAAEF